MKQKTSALYWLRVTALGVILGFGLQIAHAWINPTQTPPNGNVSGPLNSSSFAQYKQGAMGFGGLIKAYLGLDANNNKIINVATPIAGTDAVNKAYVDAAGGGGGGGDWQCTIPSTHGSMGCINPSTGSYCSLSACSDYESDYGSRIAWVCTSPSNPSNRCFAKPTSI